MAATLRGSLIMDHHDIVVFSLCVRAVRGPALVSMEAFLFVAARDHDGEFVNGLHVGEVRITSRQCLLTPWCTPYSYWACTHHRRSSGAATSHVAAARCPWSSVCVLETGGHTRDRPTAAFKWWRWHNAPQVKIFSLLHPIYHKLDAVCVVPKSVVLYQGGEWLRQSSEWINWFILGVNSFSSWSVFIKHEDKWRYTC